MESDKENRMRVKVSSGSIKKHGEPGAHLGRCLEDGLALGAVIGLGIGERINAIVVLLVDVAVGVDEELEQRGVVTGDMG